MSLSLFPAVASFPPRKRGRPAVAHLPAERERHIQCALLRLCHGASVDAAARAFGVSPRTVANWVGLALTYDDPRCNYLREVDGRA